jgi:hypothetical protein
LPCRPAGYGPDPAEKQRRYRERQSALKQSEPTVFEHALLLDAERWERGELSDQERIALAELGEPTSVAGAGDSYRFCRRQRWRRPIHHAPKSLILLEFCRKSFHFDGLPQPGGGGEVVGPSDLLRY